MTLSSADKEKVKRAIPKASSKVLAASVARLYIAYPDPQQWTYTGLSGAVVLVDDLVGHTFFLKLVDINGHRGVLWDQELYVGFTYNQDRSFFHTFEIEECYVGLLFDDTNDASSFYKKVTSREKHGSKKTVQNRNALAAKRTPIVAKQQAGPRGESTITGEQRVRKTTNVLYYDDLPPAEWRSLYQELAAAGITEDMIADNKQFIKDYIKQQGGPLVGLEPPIPRKYQHPTQNIQSSPSSGPGLSIAVHKKKAPPPPPSMVNEYSPSPVTSVPVSSIPSPEPIEEPSPSPSIADTVPLPSNQPVHRVPPPPSSLPPPTNRGYTPQRPPSLLPSQRATPTPPPTQRPVPPSLPQGQRPGPPLPPQTTRPTPPPPVSRAQPPLPPSNNRGLPPAPPMRRAGVPPPAPPSRRGAAPPPPPSRVTPQSTGVPQSPYTTVPATVTALPPTTLPPRQQMPPPTAYQAPPIAPPLPQQTTANVPVAPSLPPPTTTFPTQSAAAAAAPPPPFPAQTNAPPPPPPPPFPTTNGTPAPPAPPPPQQGNMPQAPLPVASGDGRDALLASIRGAGIGSLKKVDKSQLDKPSVLLQEQKGETVTSSGGATPGGAPGGSLQDALAAALNSRKQKVSRSDDESDGEEW